MKKTVSKAFKKKLRIAKFAGACRVDSKGKAMFAVCAGEHKPGLGKTFGRLISLQSEEVAK